MVEILREKTPLSVLHSSLSLLQLWGVVVRFGVSSRPDDLVFEEDLTSIFLIKNETTELQKILL